MINDEIINTIRMLRVIAGETLLIKTILKYLLTPQSFQGNN
jgi:hypothetical protein